MKHGSKAVFYLPILAQNFFEPQTRLPRLTI